MKTSTCFGTLICLLSINLPAEPALGPTPPIIAEIGASQAFANVADCTGELHPPNQIVYPNAFGQPGSGEFLADVRYSWRRGSFSQEVILKQDPTPLLQPGFGPETLLECWTEFQEAPEPNRTVGQVDGMLTESLDFGDMIAGAGEAFRVGSDSSEKFSVGVSKRWIHSNGRTFLVEAVRFSAIAAELLILPPAHAMLAPPPQGGQARIAPLRDPWLERSFPPPPRGKVSTLQGVRPNEHAKAGAPNAPLSARIRMAAVSSESQRGLSIDYEWLTGSLTNYTLKGDTTYWIPSSVTFQGTTFWEGGAVI